MAGPFITRDFELFVQLESAWGVSPGALAGADAFKSRTKFPFKRTKARYDRDNDMDNAQASVVSTQGGRESGEWNVSLDVIPGGNAATPTEPDTDPFLEAHLGSKHKATANTTTTSGSTTTVVNLVGGGFAAAGLQDGDMVAVDVSVAFGIEVRQILSHATDAITLDRALSGAPTTGRNVYGGTTYRLSQAVLKSVYLWGYLNGNNFRHAMPGSLVRELGIDIDFNNETPVASLALSGTGQQIITHSTSRPTPVTIGQPLLPSAGKVWIGTGLLSVTKLGLKSHNGGKLRQSESASLFPTGVYRGENKSRYMITASLELLLLTGAIEGYFDGAANLTAYDALVQLGATAGQICAWRMPKLIPDADVGDTADEVSLALSGRCYAGASGVTGQTNDDELILAFL
jgi:hypothetical protein